MQVIYNDRYGLHATHEIKGRRYDMLEIPARAEVILRAIREVQLGSVGTPQDHGIEPILAIHAPDYIEFLKSAFERNTALVGEPIPLYPEIFPTRQVVRQANGLLGVTGYYAMDADSPILAHTWEAAYWSAQCALTAADIVRAGEETVYALCRPPGHHAARDMYGGFCYLNNAAIAARYLQKMTQPDIRIAILDIDYHHGNGTQMIFYSDPTVLFCSLHGHPDIAYPYYSGMGDELGERAGEGYNRNWPLPRGTGGREYLAALAEALDLIRGYLPHYLVVSAGFDTSAGDPYGDFLLTPDDLHAIGRQIAMARLPTLLVQEGGYLVAKLGEQATAFLRGVEKGNSDG